MFSSSHDRRHQNHVIQLIGIAVIARRVFSLIVYLAVVVLSQAVSAQPRVESSFCNHGNAVEIVLQQIDATKTFDDTRQRITVLTRAADLLWPYRQQKARTAFLDALDLAILNFKDKGDNPKREGVRLSISMPDQRYVVIGAIAKRDQAWAAKLTEQVLREESKQAEEEVTKDPQRDIGTASKLLDAALLLLPSNVNASTNFARRSLSYPASLGLPIFLYKLAEVNQSASDQFYGEALAAYRDKPMGEFLYLSAYPFGNDREAGDMPTYARYRIPPGFVRRNALQRLFLQMLLRRAQPSLENYADTVNAQVSETRQIWLALTRLEPQVQQILARFTCGNAASAGNRVCAAVTRLSASRNP